MEIIVGRQGNQRTPITDATVSRKHCRLTDNGDGTFTLENISTTACTYVNGLQVFKTTVKPADIIGLGENVRTKVADLLPLTPAAPAAPAASVKEYSIRHLEEVWKEYDRRTTEIKEEQRNTNLLRSLAPMFTMGSGAVAGIAKACEWDESIFIFTIVLTVIGILIMLFAFIKGYRDSSIEDTKSLNRWMQDNYVCPNPDCRHFVGMKDYHVLRQDIGCPYCKCKFKS